MSKNAENAGAAEADVNETDSVQFFTKRNAESNKGNAGVSSAPNGKDNFPNVQRRDYDDTIPERYPSEYNMNHKNRGYALIFNHINVKGKEKRESSNLDCQKLKHVLNKHLQFKVCVCNNYDLKDIKEKLKWAAQQDHTHNDCILVAIMSHGDENGIMAKDKAYKLTDVINYFTAENCPSLDGKPKLIFVQACQGEHCDPGVSMVKTLTESNTTIKHANYKTSNLGCYSFTTHPDFLIANSTMPDFCSFRGVKSGSWFIQSLCDELLGNAKHLHLLTILTFVSQCVAIDYESNIKSEPEKDQMKQIPCTHSTLLRLVRFNDKPNANTYKFPCSNQ